MDDNVEHKMCSFCGTPGKKGTRLVAGLGAMMCEPCVNRYYELLHSPDRGNSARQATSEAMSKEEILRQIPLISRNADQAAAALVEWVGVARERKISWAQISGVLGVSRQSAWERFAARIAVLRYSPPG